MGSSLWEVSGEPEAVVGSDIESEDVMASKRMTNSEIAERLYTSHVTQGRYKEMVKEAWAAGKKAPKGSDLLKDKDRGATSPLDGRAKAGGKP